MVIHFSVFIRIDCLTVWRIRKWVLFCLFPHQPLKFISSLNNVSHHHHRYHFVDVYSIYFLFANHNAHCCLYLTTYCNGLDIQLPPFITAIITILLWHLYSASFLFGRILSSSFFLMYFVFLFRCLSFCMPLLLTCSTFSRMVLNPFLFYWITLSPTLILCSILDRFSSCFSLFCSSGLDLFLSGFQYFIPYFVAEYSQVTCLRGKFSSSLFLEKKKHLSYFTVWQGLELQSTKRFSLRVWWGFSTVLWHQCY